MSKQVSGGAQSLFCVSEAECDNVVSMNDMYLCVEKCSYPMGFVKESAAKLGTRTVSRCVGNCTKYVTDDTGEYKCVEGNDSSYVVVETNHHYVTACPDWLPFRIDKECVQACPQNYHITGNN